MVLATFFYLGVQYSEENWNTKTMTVKSVKCYWQKDRTFHFTDFDNKDRLTLIILLPCMPSGSWLIARTPLCWRRAFDVGFILAKSADTKSGAANIAHNPIWTLSSSRLSPKSPTTNCQSSDTPKLPYKTHHYNTLLINDILYKNQISVLPQVNLGFTMYSALS